MTADRQTNPFDLIKASDFSDSEILSHWVDISHDQGGLVSVLKPQSILPMLLLGGKGSGKTHLMRFCSAPVQAARHGNRLSVAVEKEGYLGVYVRAEGLNTGKFEGKGQSSATWSSVFSMYFELWLATNLLMVIRTHLSDDHTTFSQEIFAAGVAELFDVDVKDQFHDLNSLLDFLTQVRKQIDFEVNNSALTNRLNDISILFSAGRLVYGIPRVVAELISSLSSTRIVYLIDEAENFTEEQQRFLNSLIRYRSGNATIKIGARLYGVRTYNTLGSGEPIKQEAEFEQVELDSFLRRRKGDYAKLAVALIKKRLSSSEGIQGSVAEDPSEYFEEIDRTNFSQVATLALMAKYDKENRERPHFKRLRSQLRNSYRMEGPEVDRIIAPLRLPELPLLEKVSILRLYRKWPKNGNSLLSLTKHIGIEARAFVKEGKSGAAEYAEVVRHFDSDLLAQLYRDCQKKVPYAGLSTLIDLSQGIPRNLLSILRHIFRQSRFSGERPFTGGIISIESQSEGVRDSAAWFWDDAQPDGYGLEVREGVEALAVFFRTIRFSERPSECDLCSFSTNFESLSDGSKVMLRMAENWSYLVRIRDGSNNKNSDSVDVKFQIGPMLAPKWEISEHRRGTIEIRQDLANAMFDPAFRSSLVPLLRARVRNLFLPNTLSNAEPPQDELFT